MNRKKTAAQLPQTREGLLTLCRDRHWTIRKTRRGHIQCISPTGYKVTHSGTPSDWRAIRNFRMHLKRAGLKPFVPIMLPVIDQNTLEENPAMFDGQPAPDSVLDTQEPAVPAKPLARGALKEAILVTLARLDPERQGVRVKDVLPGVRELYPSINMQRLGVALANFTKNGTLKRPLQAHYALADSQKVKGPRPAAVAAESQAVPTVPAAAPASPRTHGKFDADLRVLDRCINAISSAEKTLMTVLSEVEQVIKKHHDIESTNAELMRLLARRGAR